MFLIPLKSFYVSLTVSWSFTWVIATASSLVTLIEDHPSIYSATSRVMFLQCESCYATSLLKGLEQSLVVLRLKSKLLNMVFKDFCGLTRGLSVMNQTTLHFTACISVLVQCFHFSICCTFSCYWEHSSLSLIYVTSSRSQLRCHFLQGALLDHPREHIGSILATLDFLDPIGPDP